MGLRASEVEALIPDARIFLLRVRRNGTIEDATADTVLQAGDIVAVAGAPRFLISEAVRGEGAHLVCGVLRPLLAIADYDQMSIRLAEGLCSSKDDTIGMFIGIQASDVEEEGNARG